MIVSLAIGVWMTSGHSRATDNLELSPSNVVSIWHNINDVILVLSANIALDDEWIEGLRALQPTTTSNTDIDAEMVAFRGKLNTLLQSSDLQAVPVPSGDLDTTSAAYMRSGTLLDNLVYYLIDGDSLASVAIYYGGEVVDDKTEKDVVAQINLASQRLDAFIEENGL